MSVQFNSLLRPGHQASLGFGFASKDTSQSQAAFTQSKAQNNPQGSKPIEADSDLEAGFRKLHGLWAANKAKYGF